jgi:hypothetical protein
MSDARLIFDLFDEFERRRNLDRDETARWVEKAQVHARYNATCNERSRCLAIVESAYAVSDGEQMLGLIKHAITNDLDPVSWVPEQEPES